MIMDRIIQVNRRKKNLRIKLNTDRFEEEKHREELFTTIHNKRFSTRGIQDIVKKYAQKCDERIKKEHIKNSLNYTKNVSVHILRHTSLSHYASYLSVAEVQSIAGHSNSSTTDIYIHIDNSQIKEKIQMSVC